MNLQKTAVARRVTGSNGGIFIIKGDFMNKQDVIREIESELQSRGIITTTKTCVIKDQGCIIGIDRYDNEEFAIKIVNETFNRLEISGYEAQNVAKSNNINYFEYKTIEPSSSTKPPKKSKAKKVPVPVPYSA